MRIAKGDRFKAAAGYVHGKIYEVAGKWNGNYVLAPIAENETECTMYSAEEIIDEVKRGRLTIVEVSK